MRTLLLFILWVATGVPAVIVAGRDILDRENKITGANAFLLFIVLLGGPIILPVLLYDLCKDKVIYQRGGE